MDGFWSEPDGERRTEGVAARRTRCGDEERDGGGCDGHAADAHHHVRGRAEVRGAGEGVAIDAGRRATRVGVLGGLVRAAAHRGENARGSEAQDGDTGARPVERPVEGAARGRGRRAGARVDDPVPRDRCRERLAIVDDGQPPHVVRLEHEHVLVESALVQRCVEGESRALLHGQDEGLHRGGRGRVADRRHHRATLRLDRRELRVLFARGAGQQAPHDRAALSARGVGLHHGEHLDHPLPRLRRDGLGGRTDVVQQDGEGLPVEAGRAHGVARTVQHSGEGGPGVRGHGVVARVCRVHRGAGVGLRGRAAAAEGGDPARVRQAGRGGGLRGGRRLRGGDGRRAEHSDQGEGDRQQTTHRGGPPGSWCDGRSVAWYRNSNFLEIEPARAGETI